jgi:hypothetical protein
MRFRNVVIAPRVEELRVQVDVEEFAPPRTCPSATSTPPPKSPDLRVRRLEPSVSPVMFVALCRSSLQRVSGVIVNRFQPAVAGDRPGKTSLREARRAGGSPSQPPRRARGCAPAWSQQQPAEDVGQSRLRELPRYHAIVVSGSSSSSRRNAVPECPAFGWHVVRRARRGSRPSRYGIASRAARAEIAQLTPSVNVPRCESECACGSTAIQIAFRRLTRKSVRPLRGAGNHAGVRFSLGWVEWTESINGSSVATPLGRQRIATPSALSVSKARLESAGRSAPPVDERQRRSCSA